MFLKVSRETFEQYAGLALEQIPAAFLPHLSHIVIDVEDMPTPEACKSVGVSNPRHLLGLYHGVPMTRRSVEQHGRLPDRITIYQSNIERACATREELIEQIRKTVLHEVGHHFGLSERDLDELGYG
ncbi:MAG: metallopeptidase family protein [Planctomycetes bacterium]|nr:metallopeptidase family protein [Planctomycetota bacterium]